MVRRPNALDRALQRWQHRWETDRQFRAVWSGVAGLLIVVGLCTCMGTVSTIVSTTVAGIAGASSGGPKASLGTPESGASQVSAAQTFPTFTSAAAPQSNAPPVGTIPASQTPMPTATAAPTPTDVPSPTPCIVNCGGGGGGGGGGGTVTGFPTPTVWTGGTSAKFTVHTSAPNVGLAIVITFPGGKTFLDENGEQTDGSGNYVSNVSVPSGISAGKADVWIQANFSGTVVNKHIKVDCLP